MCSPASTNTQVAMQHARTFAIEQAVADGAYGADEDLEVLTDLRRGRVVVTLRPR